LINETQAQSLPHLVRLITTLSRFKIERLFQLNRIVPVRLSACGGDSSPRLVEQGILDKLNGSLEYDILVNKATCCDKHRPEATEAKTKQ